MVQALRLDLGGCETNRGQSRFLRYHQGLLGETFTLRSFMRQLGHTNVTLVQMDCEGCEFGALTPSTMPSEGAAVQQILFEVHYNWDPFKAHTLF